MSKTVDDFDIFGDADETAKETSGGAFVRLKDGEEVDLFFVKIPVFSYKTVWNTATNRSEIYDESKHSGEQPGGKFRFVVARLPDKGDPEPSILEVSTRMYETIKAVLKKKGFRRSYTYSRKGTGQESVYTLMNNDELSEDALELLEKLEYPDHTKLGNDDNEEAPSNEKPVKKSPWGKK